jgi:hypothetical protein
MPLIKCGPDSYKWGNSGKCYHGKDAKRQVILQGVSYEGSHKVNQLLKNSRAAFIDQEGVEMAKSALKELYPRGYLDSFTQTIANFFKPASAGTLPMPGGTMQNGDFAEEKDEATSILPTTPVNPAPSMPSVPSTGEMFDVNHPSPTADPNSARSDDMENDEDMDTSMADDGQNDSDRNIELYPEGPGKKDTESLPGGEYSNDGLRDINHDNDKTESYGVPDSMVYSNLDDQTNDRTKVIVPPYNKEASPESDPNEKVPDFDPPSRDDMNPTEANIYHDDEEKEAVEAKAFLDYIAVCFNTKAFISTETRKNLDPDVFCGPNSTFPLRNQSDLPHIAQLLHHAQNPSEVKRRAIRRAHQLSLKLPHTWQHDPDQVGH